MCVLLDFFSIECLAPSDQLQIVIVYKYILNKGFVWFRLFLPLLNGTSFDDRKPVRQAFEVDAFTQGLGGHWVIMSTKFT